MAARRRTDPSGKGPRSRNGQVARSPGERAPRKNKTVKTGPLPLIIILTIVLAGIGVIAYLSIAPYYTDKITNGVTINGMDVSGMTAQEALAALTASAGEHLGNVAVTLNYEGRTWTYGADEVNATIDFTGAVNSAASVARTGNLSQRKAEAGAALAGEYVFDSSIDTDADNLENYLAQIKQEIDVAPVEPTMAMQCDGPNYTVAGYDHYLAGVDYSGLFMVTPGSDGRDVDVDATMNLLREGLAQDYTANVNLIVSTQPPSTTGQSLRDSVVLLYHSSSVLNHSSDNRNTNIRMALSNFDGKAIAPGQTVSFNDTVGERTEERGYMKAKQIGPNGYIEYEVGGGICQAATTLFNAAINAGCDIVERNPHKWPLYYNDYDWGLDAMVNWGTSDLKFTNTTGGYLYLDFYFSYTDGEPSAVNIDIYGMPFEDGMTLEIKSVKVSEYPAPSARYERKGAAEVSSIDASDWKYDKNLGLMTYVKVASRPGYVFRIYREWFKDGQEVGEEELYTTEYPAIQGITYTKTP